MLGFLRQPNLRDRKSRGNRETWQRAEEMEYRNCCPSRAVRQSATLPVPDRKNRKHANELAGCASGIGAT